MFGLRTVHQLSRMFHIGVYASVINEECFHLIASNWLLLLCCVVFCTNMVSYVGHKFQQQFPRISEVVSLAFNLGLMALVLAFMV